MASQKALNRLRESFLKHQAGNEEIEDSKIAEYKERFLTAINDDLNMPLAMGAVWEAVREEKKSPKIAELLRDCDKVLGLDLANAERYLQAQTQIEIPEEILELLEKRKKAREDKNWELSDQLRDELREKGYIVKDTKEGMTLEKV